MPEIKNTFLKGKMNKDADERILPSGEYKDALNIQVGISEQGDAGSIHNILGNTKISTINISGARCIGSIADTQNEKIYWFIYGTTINAIAEYNETTGAIAPVLVDISNGKIQTNFPNTQITAISVLDGYLFWTDNNSEPKIIDINQFKSGSSNFSTQTQIYGRDFVEADIVVIKKKPASAPTVSINIYGETIVNATNFISSNPIEIDSQVQIEVTQDPNFDVNQNFFVIGTVSGVEVAHELKFISFTSLPNPTVIAKVVSLGTTSTAFIPNSIKAGNALFEDKFIRFAYRWKFKNNQISVFSPFTEPVFQPKEIVDYNVEEGYNNSMLNQVRSIQLNSIDLSLDEIEAVDILYKEANNTNVYIYKTLNKEDFSNYLTGSGSINISAESIYSVIPQTQLFRQYDNVPYRAKAGEISSNRIIFGNYIDGLNTVLNNQNNYTQYNPNFNISVTNRANNKLRSIKTGRKYQLGIVFEDEYGRQTPVFSNDTGEYNLDFNKVRPDNNLTGGNQFEISMSALPNGIAFDPRIKKFKYYIKETSGEYYNIIVKEAVNDNVNSEFAWLIVPSYEINKLQEDDYIILKKGSRVDTPLADKNLKYKVLSIKGEKPENIGTTTNYKDHFFVKIKSDSYIQSEILSVQGNGGQNVILQENEFYYTSSIPDSSVLIHYFDYQGTRTNYYYKDGKIYEYDGQQVNEASQANSITESGATSENSPCDNGTYYNSATTEGVSFPFTDTSGNEVSSIHYEINNISIPYITKVVICYTNSSSSTTLSTAVFETIPDNNLLDIYYESEESYNIADYSSVKTLRWFNCFDFGNGLESNRIRDDFNEVTIDNQVRVSTVLKDIFKQKENKYGLIFSGIYNSRNSINNLNEFNTADSITKDINPEYGSIQKLHARNTDIVIFCEDKVLKVLANKDALYNADGNVNLTATNNVLGQAITFNGEFGISTNPESFAQYGYQVYFTDKARNAVLRLSIDGLTVISEYGMSDFFRDKFNLQTLEESIAFKEGINGWTSRLSFVPESGVSLNGKYYTFKAGELWKHYNATTAYNNFYGNQYDSKIKFVYNQEPSAIKNFKTLNYEGTQGWSANTIQTNEQSGKILNFVEKEGKWFNNIKGSEANESNIDLKSFSVQGLGNISSYSGSLIDASTTTSSTSETLITPENILGTYDIYSKQYILSFTTNATEIVPTSSWNCVNGVCQQIIGTSGTYATESACQTACGVLPIFTCSDAELTIDDGCVGNTVTGSVVLGTIVQNSISPNIYSLSSPSYSANITIPSGYQNSGNIINCSFTPTVTSCIECDCANAQFSISDGTTDDTIQINTDATVATGYTLNSVSPNTYQQGTATYTANITINGTNCNNAGSVLTTCTAQAQGTAAVECDCADAQFSISNGIAGDTIQIGTDATVATGFTLNSVSPTTYQQGTTTYTANITITDTNCDNVGSVLTTCTAQAQVPIPSITITQTSGATSPSVGGQIELTATANNFTATDWAWSGGNASGTQNVVTITENSVGSYTYTASANSGAVTANFGPVNWINCQSINLGYHATDSASACSATATNYYSNQTTFCLSTTLHTDPNCTNIAPAGYYSDSTNNRYWDGSSFTACSNCGSTLNSWSCNEGTGDCVPSETGYATEEECNQFCNQTPQTMNVQVRECGTTSPTHALTISNANNLTNGQVFTATTPAFYTNKYWEIINNNYIGSIDDIVTISTVLQNCPVVNCDCGDAQLSVYNGITGTSVNATVASGYTINSITPSTYQAGTNTYTASITVSSSCPNSGAIISCTDTALGDAAYYKINACNQALGPCYTTNPPQISSQRYIDLTTNEYYVYDNAGAVIGNQGNPCGGSIQIVTGQSGCPSTTPTTYDCVNGDCVENGSGNGQYTTLQDCENNCSPPPPTYYTLTLYANSSSGTNPLQGWGTSTDACSGTGTPVPVYLTQNVSSLQDAFNNGYTLYSNNTANPTPYAGNNTFFKDVSSPSTGNTFVIDNSGIISGFSVCTAPPTYDCVNGECQETTGGQYATLQDCQNNCTPPVTCYAISFVARDASSSATACNALQRTTHYFDSPNFCSATIYYGTSSSCVQETGSYWVSDGENYRYWSGSSFGSCSPCS